MCSSSCKLAYHEESYKSKESVGDEAEDYNVNSYFCNEERENPVISTCIFMTILIVAHYHKHNQKNCVTYIKIALSLINRSIADKLPNAWLTQMKKNTPTLRTTIIILSFDMKNKAYRS